MSGKEGLLKYWKWVEKGGVFAVVGDDYW